MLVSVEFGEAGVGLQQESIQRVARALKEARRVIAVTGAGISVSAGIPDFRSADGLYARVLAPPATGNDSAAPKKPAPNKECEKIELPGKSAKGKDFFDAGFFHNPATRPLFNRFVAELQNMSANSQPTATHKFLKKTHDEGRVLRWYTQNIDGLEKAVGLGTSCCGSGNSDGGANASAKKSAPVVALHGTLERLSCTHCKTIVAFARTHQEAFERGDSPACEKCAAFSADRQANGRRPVKSGILRPDIVLYNEPHPQGDEIAAYLSSDISRRPNMLLVMGTSLKVVGLKKIVKDLARAVHQTPDGLVVFVNKTPAARSVWKTVFDYELLGECDQWVSLLDGAQCKLPSAADPSAASAAMTAPATLTPKARRDPAVMGDGHQPSPAAQKDGRIDHSFRVSRKASSALSAERVKKDVGQQRRGAEGEDQDFENADPKGNTLGRKKLTAVS